MKLAWIASLLIPLVSGCGTLVARTGYMNEGRECAPYYPATVIDCGFMGNAFDQEDRTFSDRVELMGLGVVDFPISLVIDTICLPYDAGREFIEWRRWSLSTEESQHRQGLRP